MFVVQIGTNNGSDHVLKLCKQYKDIITGIVLVEPFAIHNESIQKNYQDLPHVQLYNVAIVADENVTKVRMYYAMADGPTEQVPQRSFEVTSICYDHLIKHDYKPSEILTFDIQAMHMNELLALTGRTVFDYVFMDIEGIDRQVLESIDFETYDIRNLQIEKLHLDLQWLIQFMTARGYEATASLDAYNYDILFRKQ